MRILTSDEVVYVLDVLKNEEESIDELTKFFKYFLSDLQNQAGLKNKDFEWLELVIDKLSNTSNNLTEISSLYNSKR